MIRVLVYVVLVFLLAAGFAWLADRPGEVVLVWQGYEVKTSLMTAAIALAIIVAIIGMVIALVRAVVRAPHTVEAFLGARRRDRGYRALSTGMIAVGAGDVRAALKSADEARAHLGEAPLTLLLAAQSAQLAGDGAKARTAFEALAARPETRILGLHGLFVEARRQGEHEAARHFAVMAAEAAPKIGWAGTALFEYQSREGDWLGALRTLAANQTAKLVDKAEARRLRAVLLTAQAMEMEAGEPEEARAAALEAIRLSPTLTPAAVVGGRLLSRAGDIRRASRLLEQAWRAEPHPEIAETYAAVRPGDSVLDRLKRVRHLVTLRANHPEGAMAFARAAIDAHDWTAARAAIENLARAEPSERVCLLMAEIEDREHGDEGRVRAWLGRALSAPRDPAWMADGRVFQRWAPVSPVSGRVGAFEWKVPPLAPAPREALEVRAAFEARPQVASAVPPAAIADSRPEPLPEPAPEPVIEIAPAPPVEPEAAMPPPASPPAAPPAPESVPAAAPPVAPPPGPPATIAAPVAVEARPPEPASATALPQEEPAQPAAPPTVPDEPAEVMTPRPPDDPGPEVRDDDDLPRRRFRLF